MANFTLAKAAPIPSEAPVIKAQALLLLPLPPYALKSKTPGKSVKFNQNKSLKRNRKRKTVGIKVRISQKKDIIMTDTRGGEEGF